MSTTMQQATAAASTMLNGVDVASFQHPGGAAINWATVHGAGYDFAAIKATEGNYYVNKYYANDAAAATAAGMYVAAYHFANPPKSSGTAQADYAVQNAGNYHVGGHYLPLALDVEYDPYSSNECYGLSPTQMVSWISDFMTEATTLTGAAPIIYTPRDWWDTCTANSTAFGKDLLWVPAYSAGSPGTLPAGWSTWMMWQYTSSGTVPGISGPVDLDYWEVTAPEVAVGAEGGDGQLWAQAPQLGSGWHPLGGKIIAPPAVAAAPNPYGSTPAQPLFIATGSNKRLYIRSLTVGWQALGPATMSCSGGPAAVITGRTLTVACRGLNNALWENTATVPPSGLPQFSHGWASLGGTLTAGPAVAPVREVMTFFVPSTNGRIYIRTLTTGYAATPWVCIGSPAAAQGASSGTLFACQGGNHALLEAVNGGAGWSSAVTLGGTLIGGPAVAATSPVPELLAESTNHAVWERTPLTGWTSLGGSVAGGVGAVALN
jgi:GH25 family lysozyme M1 (1,4-beta-N-acetylmuramidase)